MTSYIFKPEFSEAIRTGAKHQTIRAERKSSFYLIQVGQRITLLEKDNNTKLKLIRTVTCKEVSNVKMTKAGMSINGTAISPGRIFQIAKADGFKSVYEFRDFFERIYGFPFDGHLIKW